MTLMIISVINHTNGKISDEELQGAIRSINRQIREDYEPYWHIGGELRLEGRSGTKPSKQNITDMRGDAVLYLWDSVDVDGALGYHDTTNAGVPYGFVFTELAKQLKEEWTVTLSHEALELVGDPEVNLLVQGPHPSDGNRTVFHWYEMCDAVQAETYEIDGVKVSNFVLPLYFTGGEEKGGRNDFLGRAYKGKTLRSFGVNPGGYVGFFDPEKGDHDTFTAKGDGVAAKRLAIKSKMKGARRGIRYQRYVK
ncbi:MAG: hypothetical protein OEY63_03270 [Gemmatimonadota bacterium]|nr:hypothetical protein [Gemmatimonadota bacterium]